MNRVIVALAVGVFIAGPTLASDKGEILAVLSQWNDDDVTEAVAACADDAAVIDEIPPYEWHGPGACSNWQKDYDAYLKKNGMTGVTGTLGKPRQLLISADRAYVVVPTTFGFTMNGKPVKITATTTFSLHKTAAGWRITGWAWATQTRK